MKNLLLILTACFIFGCSPYNQTECSIDSKEEVQTFYRNCLANARDSCGCDYRVILAFPDRCYLIDSYKACSPIMFK